MCYNCDCHMPKDDMGNPANITDETFEKAAAAWGQSVDEAKLNTYKLLRQQLKKAGKLAKERD